MKGKARVGYPLDSFELKSCVLRHEPGTNLCGLQQKDRDTQVDTLSPRMYSHPCTCACEETAIDIIISMSKLKDFSIG